MVLKCRLWSLLISAGCVLFCLSDGISAAQPGYIRGEIRDLSNTPLSGIEVHFYDEQWSYLSSVSTRSDPDGSYVSGSLQPGRYYVRAGGVYPSPYIAEYWFNTRSRIFAIPVEVEEGCDTFGINFSLEEGGFIRGEIRTEDDESLDGVDLDLYSENWRWLQDWTCRSKEDGCYILGPVPEGKYYVRADPDPEHWSVQQYWPEAYYRADARIVAIHPRDDISGIDFRLQPAGAAQGCVVLETGAPVSECRIRVFDYLWTEQPVHKVFSDETGAYLAFGLPEGCFYFQADPVRGAGCTDQYYPDTDQRPFARCVYITPETTAEGIDFHLPQGNFDVFVDLKMPNSFFHVGETFSLKLDIEHHGPDLKGLPVFVLLELHDTFYFWPSWISMEEGIDFEQMDISDGDQTVWIFEPFAWPGAGSALSDIWFHAAVVNWTMTDTAGNIASVSWGCE